MTQMRFDGFDVNVFEGKVSGKFEMDDVQAGKLGLDRVVIFVCAARLGKAQVETTGEGDIKRTNTFAVSDVRMLEGEMREQAIRFLADPLQETLDFDLDDDEDDLEPVGAATNGRSE